MSKNKIIFLFDNGDSKESYEATAKVLPFLKSKGYNTFCYQSEALFYTSENKSTPADQEPLQQIEIFLTLLFTPLTRKKIENYLLVDEIYPVLTDIFKDLKWINSLTNKFLTARKQIQDVHMLMDQFFIPLKPFLFYKRDFAFGKVINHSLRNEKELLENTLKELFSDKNYQYILSNSIIVSLSILQRNSSRKKLISKLQETQIDLVKIDADNLQLENYMMAEIKKYATQKNGAIIIYLKTMHISIIGKLIMDSPKFYPIISYIVCPKLLSDEIVNKVESEIKNNNCQLTLFENDLLEMIPLEFIEDSKQTNKETVPNKSLHSFLLFSFPENSEWEKIPTQQWSCKRFAHTS